MKHAQCILKTNAQEENGLDVEHFADHPRPMEVFPDDQLIALNDVCCANRVDNIYWGGSVGFKRRYVRFHYTKVRFRTSFSSTRRWIALETFRCVGTSLIIAFFSKKLNCCLLLLGVPFTCESSEMYQQRCGVRNLLISLCFRLDIFPHEMSISLDPPAQYQSSAVEDCATLDDEGVYTSVCA